MKQNENKIAEIQKQLKEANLQLEASQDSYSHQADEHRKFKEKLLEIIGTPLDETDVTDDIDVLGDVKSKFREAKSLLKDSVEVLWDNCDCGECGPCNLSKQIEQFLGIDPFPLKINEKLNKE